MVAISLKVEQIDAMLYTLECTYLERLCSSSRRSMIHRQALFPTVVSWAGW